MRPSDGEEPAGSTKAEIPGKRNRIDSAALEV